MVLPSQQIQELQNALISALLDKVSLEQMLLVELEKKSSIVANEGNFPDFILKLIQTADLEGWVEYLICTAYNHNPENPKLQRFIQKISLKKSSDLRVIIEQKLEYEYDNLEEIGTGAFGITYRASIKNQQRYVVIKTIKIDELYQIIKSNNQETEKEFCQEIKSFAKEAEFLSSFKHDHIVGYHQHLTRKLNFVLNNKQDRNLYSVYELELPFLIMEYIEGENLEEYMSKRDFPLEETEALRYIQQIGAALTVVHDQGVLHRDIKPKNIMVREGKHNAVLIDFGIAREFSPNVTQTHTVAFTQGYAPPEQLNRKEQRGKYTDIYGLAATLYYLLTKKHPSHALNRIIKPLDEPKKLNSRISDRVNEAIMWGMELESSKRPQTVQQWLTKIFSPECEQGAINSRIKTESFEFDTVTLIVKNSGVGGTERTYEIKHSRGSVECFQENLGNGVILEMVSLPGGKFIMGSPATELKRDATEGPQHCVTIQPFFIGKFTVTQAEWKRVAALPKVNRDLRADPSCFKGDKRPVEFVSWYDTVEFCDRLAKHTHKPYRLPSEAEWEYACRAGTTTPFCFGETITTELANYDGNYTYTAGNTAGTKGKFRQETTEVGTFPANAFGLYDMHGNVWEWCQDNYHDSYQDAPTNGKAWLNDNIHQLQVRRGGSWFYYPELCRSAYRNGNTPDMDLNSLGFRVVFDNVMAMSQESVEVNLNLNYI